jgi:hypothetical protein
MLDLRVVILYFSEELFNKSYILLEHYHLSKVKQPTLNDTTVAPTSGVRIDPWLVLLLLVRYGYED